MPETIENIQPGEIGATTVFGVSNLFLLICCQESERRRVAVTRPHLFSKSQFRDVLPFVPGPPRPRGACAYPPFITSPT